MPRPDLVVDANAFSSKDLWHWLPTYRGRKILPVIAFVEVGVHRAAQGRLERFSAYLAESRIEVEWMRSAEGDRAIAAALEFGDFGEHAHDYMIAGHVYGERVLVTSNVKDFKFLANVVTPDEAMKRYS